MHGRISPHRICIAAGSARLLKPWEGTDDSEARYRSPEQVRGEPVDWRSDIFAFGILLYEMASGKPAFTGEGADLDDVILHESPASLIATSPAAAVMEGVIAGCLEKDPARRRQRIQNALIELKLSVACRQALPFVWAPRFEPPESSPPAAVPFIAPSENGTAAGRIPRAGFPPAE